jgi:hypothetical protein
MAGGDDTRNHPRRRIIRGHSNRDPFEAQGKGKVQGRFFNANRNPITENEDIHDAAFMYKQYFDGEVGN